MISFNLILPELNDYISKLGGSEYKGLIIFIFTISAALSRPFSGKLSDFIGRKSVMFAGMTVSIVVCLLYPFVETVFFFLILRFVHGFSAGFTPTGATALVTDIIPEERRGAGMGIWGTFISLGIGIGQGASFFMVKWFGVNGMFVAASLCAFVSMAFLSSIQETLEEKESFVFAHLKITWRDVFERNVLPSAIVMFLSAISSGIIFVLASDISEFLKIENKGWFFLFYVLSTIGLRLFASRLSDVIGRRQTMVIGMGILIVSMFLIGSATNLVSFTIGSIVFGLATGISSPTLFAWTADLSPDNRRGVGAGTMFIALELGVMAGSVITLLVYNNSKVSVFYTFLCGLFFASLAFLYLLWHLFVYKAKR